MHAPQRRAMQGGLAKEHRDAAFLMFLNPGGQCKNRLRHSQGARAGLAVTFVSPLIHWDLTPAAAAVKK